MAHAEKTVIIQRPVRSVFDFVLNGANNHLWRASVLEARPEREAPYGPGSKFQQRIAGPDGPMAGDYEITQCRQDELIEFQMSAGALRARSTYRFWPEGSATGLTLTVEVGARSDPVAQRWVDEEVGMLGELKAFLEKHV